MVDGTDADVRQVWPHPRLRVAVAAEDWAAVFREWRRLTGRSQTRLGALVGLAQSDVSDIERGRRRVTSQEVRQRIVAGLGVPPELLGAEPSGGWPVAAFVLPSLAPDADLLDRITRVVREPGRVDAASVDWLDRLLAEHRRVEDTIGSGPLFDVMRRQLSTVVDLHAGAVGELATRTVRLAAEHAQFLAWLCQDRNEQPSALAWYDRAHDWALAAEDANMAATTLSMKAHAAWSAGDARRCVALAEAARWHDVRTSLGVQGMASQMVARGHAIAGDSDATRRLLDEAQLLITRAAERPEDEPPWLYFYDEAWFTLQRGMAELHLRHWTEATHLLRTGLAGVPETYRRDRAWYQACLAHAYAGAGEVEAAATTALSCIPDAAIVGRPHTWNELCATVAVLLRKGAPEAHPIQDLMRSHE
ncbi:helix-turn-helix domain-containing protein [Embleya sp. AB8]|uniref:helix-turn-helix domain-containing protein n=1 Tax=Embleya sp. AB8 TaxID=3156304 RepID=UPI003C74DA9D